MNTIELVFLNTAQAFLSASFSIILGFIGALGLLSLNNNKNKSLFSFIYLLPNMLPTLVVIIAVMEWFSFAGKYSGFLQTVSAHVLLNIGVASVGIYYLIEKEASAKLQLSLFEGASRIKSLVAVFLYDLKYQVLVLFFMVFALAFTSLSVPLFFDGSAFSMEITIYKAVKIESDYKAASLLALLQFLIVLIFSFVILKGKKSEKQSLKSRVYNINSFGLSLGLVIPVVTSLYLLTSVLKEGLSAKAFSYLDKNLTAELGILSLKTAMLSLSVGLLIAAIFLLIGLLYPLKKTRKFLLGVVAPSSILIALVIYPIGPISELFAAFKITAVLALLFLPHLIRYTAESFWQDYNKTHQSGLFLGASKVSMWWPVYIKQAMPMSLKAGAFAALWTAGDFGVSSFLSYNDFTLALFAKTVLSSYKLELGAFTVLLLLLVGGLVASLFWSLAYVSDKKLKL